MINQIYINIDKHDYKISHFHSWAFMINPKFIINFIGEDINFNSCSRLVWDQFQKNLDENRCVFNKTIYASTEFSDELKLINLPKKLRKIVIVNNKTGEVDSTVRIQDLWAYLINVKFMVYGDFGFKFAKKCVPEIFHNLLDSRRFMNEKDILPLSDIKRYF